MNNLENSCASCRTNLEKFTNREDRSTTITGILEFRDAAISRNWPNIAEFRGSSQGRGISILAHSFSFFTMILQNIWYSTCTLTQSNIYQGLATPFCFEVKIFHQSGSSSGPFHFRFTHFIQIPGTKWRNLKAKVNILTCFQGYCTC
jgi:hypothetical protein